MNKRYILIDSDTDKAIAEFDDYNISDKDTKKMEIQPIRASTAASRTLNEDLVFLCRENYLMLRKLLDHYDLLKEG